MVIQFISRSDVFRSRIAEAHFKSFNLPGIKVKSVMLAAAENSDSAVAAMATELIKRHGLARYGKQSAVQLTQSQLDRADMAICMNRRVHLDVLAAGYVPPKRTIVWNVADVDELLRGKAHREGTTPHIAEQTFAHIVTKVDELAAYLRRPMPTEQVDVLEPDGSPAGRTANIDEIHTRGLWHSGIHAAVVSRDGRALFEKRTSSMIINPGQWDFTVGGIVSAGETPEVGLAREVHEELGIKLDSSHVTKLFTVRYNHYLPSYGLRTRVMLHTYLIVIEGTEHLRLQASEVADAKFFSFAEARDFIRRGRSQYGQFGYAHEFYLKLLTAAIQAVGTNAVS